MGTEANLPLPPPETMGIDANLPLQPPEPESLRSEDQDWVFALGESVSFGRFLSEPLEWGGMVQVPAVKPTSMGHVQSPPTVQLDLHVQSKFSMPVAAVEARSASSKCGDMCIGGSRPGHSFTPVLEPTRSLGSAAHMGASELYLSRLEPMESISQSVGSTTPIALEDDANSSFTDAKEFVSYGGDSYSTPRKTSSMSIRGSTYEPECDESLQPRIGMIFHKWEDGEGCRRLNRRLRT